MDAYDTYRFSFESCKSYKDGAVSPNDFARVCNRYKLNYKLVMEYVGTDGEGCFSLDSFIHYLKKCQSHSYTNHVPSGHSSHAQDVDSYVRSTSPPHRPSSVSKVGRQSVHSGGSHNHSRSGSGRYPVSPTTAREENGDMNEDHGVRRTRTPDNFLSPEEKPRHSERLRSDMYEHHPVSSRSRTGTHSRAAIDTPPPTVTHHPRNRYRGDVIAGRSEKARSFKDSDDEDVMQDSYYPSVSRPRYKHQMGEGHEGGSKSSRWEAGVDKSRNKDGYDNQDRAYAQLYRENEKLKQKLIAMKKESTAGSDSPYIERQFDDLKKAKEDAEEDLRREKSSHKAARKDCNALKQEYNKIRSKYEELERINWRLSDENHKLTIKLMEEDRSSSGFSRRPGDGGSGEPSARSSYASELSFQRSHLRQTYHGTTGKGDVSKDTSSRSKSKGRPDMKRVSSEGKPLDYEDPGKDNHINYPKAKTHKSAGTSSAGSIMDSLALTMVSTTPDEQSQVFMVLGEDVSKSVLPESLPKDKELAMMYALQNCHSVQELIKCLVSYGVSSSSDQLQGFQVENKHLQERVEHLKAKNTAISESFQSSKLNMDEMYHNAEKIEANNVRLRHALIMAQHACEAFEVLFELRSGYSRHGGSNGSYFPSFESSSFDSTLARSPDREQVSIKHTATYRARCLLHSLDSNVELQSYPPLVNMRQGSGEYHSHTTNWLPGTLSQNTGTTSGLSSMSGGIEGDITQAEIDRLKQYSQALLHYENHLTSTLVPMDGLEGLKTIKKPVVVKDCYQADASGSITDLEDAAHAEELCKVREEKAELRSQIYMMEQEKRRMELEVSRMLIHKQKSDRQVAELQFQLKDEKRKRKKEQKKRKSEASIPPHDPSHINEFSLDYTSALEREREVSRRYDDLFGFLQCHIKDSQDTTEHLMTFVKELRRANSALVDAFEKSKKRQQAEKKRMKTDLVSYINRIQGGTEPLLDEPTPVGPLHT